MKTYSELLYWRQYEKYIHYDEKKGVYVYDKKLPERAKKSFEAWIKQF